MIKFFICPLLELVGVSIELLKFNTFYEAEDYHSDYFENNENHPYCKVVILPKVRKFEGMYKKNLKMVDIDIKM